MADSPRDSYGLAGTTIDGKYRVDSVIGAGGFGVVYRGVHGAFQEPIAVKCLEVPRGLSGEQREDLLSKLQDEGAVLHRLSKRSSAIVQALDVGAVTTEGGHWVPYLVLEWLEGQPLNEHLATRRAEGRGGMPLDEALTLLAPVANALALAHRQRIAHRDVKPENIYLTEIDGERTTKVLDFGIAKVLAEHGRFTASPTATRDAPSAFTPRYGAPEQFDKKRGATGPWTDVFALALIIVEMVSGEAALDGDDPVQLYVAAADPSARPTLRMHGVATSDEVDSVLRRALAIDPKGRFPEAAAFWSALCSAAAVAVPTATESEATCATGEYVVRRSLSVDEEKAVTAADHPSGHDGATAASLAAMGTDPLASTEAASSTAPAPALPTARITTAASEPPPLSHERFQVEIIGLANRGTALTIANVVAAVGLEPNEAEASLEQMVSQGRLERSHDPLLDQVVYRVLGLTGPPGAGTLDAQLGPLRRFAQRWLAFDVPATAPLPPEQQKSLSVGAVVAGLCPPFGLLYSAPFPSTLLVLLIGALATVLSTSVPIVGPYMHYVSPPLFGMVCAALGATYVLHYNRHGRRMSLRKVRQLRRTPGAR